MGKKKYKTLIIIGIFLSILCASAFLQAEKKKSKKKIIKELVPEYKKWLTLVHYIITPNELEVFLELKNNRDRKSFINLFWKMRDPSKGTPANEYKEEHLKRFIYANRYYKHGSPLPGWKTDRGRIHIILGPPISREEIIAQNGIRPVEIWEYFGGAEKGLPTVFRMVFYKKHGSGGYRQYVPAVDGPSALLKSEIGKINTNDYYSIYSALKELNPTVADIALTLIPGEPLHNYSPSFRGPILMSKVYNYPKKKINTTYAKNFLSFKGIVKTYSTSEYISTIRDVYLLKDPTLGLNFIHIALRPEKISVGYLEDKEKYYLNFTLTVVLKKGKEIILKYDKNFPLYYSKEELEKTISHGLIITDHFPVIPGKFKLLTVLQNSVNREISYNESEIDTRPNHISDTKTLKPILYKPLISYRINSNSRDVYSPFKIISKNIKIDPKRMFGLKDSLSTIFCVEKGDYNKNFQVELEVTCLDERRKYQKKYSFVYPKEKSIWYFTKKLDKLKYGNYILKLNLIGDNGLVINTEQNDFQISPSSYIPHPPQVFTILKKENTFMFYMTLARQFQQIKNLKKANTLYEKAFKLNSSAVILIKNYTSFLIQLKKYDKALAIIDHLKKHGKEMFNYFVLKGRIFYYQKKYNEAINILLKANKIYDSDITALNTLGFSFIRIGNNYEALRALPASLKINNLQKNILKIKQQLENEKR